MIFFGSRYSRSSVLNHYLTMKLTRDLSGHTWQRIQTSQINSKKITKQTTTTISSKIQCWNEDVLGENVTSRVVIILKMFSLKNYAACKPTITLLEKKQFNKNCPEEAQTLDFARQIICHYFKYTERTKWNQVQRTKETMRTIFPKTENQQRQKLWKGTRIEILELKSTKTKMEEALKEFTPNWRGRRKN